MEITKKSREIFSRLGLPPRTRLGRFTAYLAALELLLLIIGGIMKLAGASTLAEPLQGWTSFLGFVLAIFATVLFVRWFRNHVMWSVRNRLIVTYLFIGGVPVVLVLLMAGISAYFFTGQFAVSLPLSEIQAETQRLQTANSATADELLHNPSRLSRSSAEITLPEQYLFPERKVKVLDDQLRPKWLKNDFGGLVADDGQLYLRATKEINSGGKHLIVLSSVPVDKTFLAHIAANLGPMTVFLPRKDMSGDVNVEIKPGRGVVINGRPADSISAGSLPNAEKAWDRAFDFYAMIQPVDWQNGTSINTLLMGTTRFSTLYSHLAGAMNEWASIVTIALVALAALFGVIVLIALLIGIRLTRTITYSVANLYRATQHINRGEFDHRIHVREKDQLAALQVSFNSMAQSLERLIAEQKEKERLQSELEIAHEVQTQLFPHTDCSTPTLELYGICRPARIVSGDYYDFLSYGPDQAGIAVGDISGKGISAALLMATIHSAVRAYEQEQLVSVGAAAYGTDARRPTLATSLAPPSPAQMLWLLNRHLYQSTQPEKYATLFLGFYDGDKRRLTYSNAGHLAPIILSEDGTVRRLEAGGMVVGLFDNMEYEEETVELRAGDIFVAFSDGMTEPENEFGEFGEERLIETIVAHRDLPLDRLSAQAISAVQDWIGATEQPDDITLVLARRQH